MPVKPKQVTVQKKGHSKTVEALASLAGISLEDTTDINQVMRFKEISLEGKIANSDAKSINALFKGLEGNKAQKQFPIVEMVGSSRVIIATAAKGFGGPIWALILVDSSSRKIAAISFKHRAESDSYGAGISKRKFYDQFQGATLLSEGRSFGLIQGGDRLVEGSREIDGIAGATITSKAAINMMNEGLKPYTVYFYP